MSDPQISEVASARPARRSRFAVWMLAALIVVAAYAALGGRLDPGLIHTPFLDLQQGTGVGHGLVGIFEIQI